MKKIQSAVYNLLAAIHWPGGRYLSFFCLAMVGTSPSFSQTEVDNTGDIRWSVSLRPYVSRTWVKDYGFKWGPFIDKPVFSCAAQAGISLPLGYKFQLFGGLGFNLFHRKFATDNSRIRVNDPTDPVYLALLANPVTYYESYHFLDVPIRIDFIPSSTKQGLVVALASTQSYWHSAHYQRTGGDMPTAERSIKAPTNRFYIAQELQAGWIFPLASGWQADARVFLMADLIRMKDISYNRTGLGLQLNVTMGK